MNNWRSSKYNELKFLRYGNCAVCVKDVGKLSFIYSNEIYIISRFFRYRGELYHHLFVQE